MKYLWKAILCILFFEVMLSCSLNKRFDKLPETVPADKIGLQAWSFRYYFPKDIPGTLDRVKALGIQNLEMGIGSGKLPPEEYRKLCEERNINIISFGASFKDLQFKPEQVIVEAKQLGAKYIMCAWIPYEGIFKSEDADLAIQVFNEFGELASKKGLIFCYHPHGFEFVPYKESTLLEYIIESTNPMFVSFEMDIHWVYTGGSDPLLLLKKYGTRWKLMHLRDMKDKKSVALGTGDFDIPPILREAKKIGIAYYFIEDLNNAEVDKQLPKSIRYLKELIFLSPEWKNLLDKESTLWESYIGIPRRTVAGIDSIYAIKKKPLGLNNDLKRVFTQQGKKIRASGEIKGAFTSKHNYSNYHLQLQFKWGKKKWGPWARDSGILYHCVGEHGYLWDVYMRSVEFQIQEDGAGDAYVVGTNASIIARDTTLEEDKLFHFSPYGEQYHIGKTYGGIVSFAIDKPLKQGWNTIDLYAKGDSAIYCVNNTLINALTNLHIVNDVSNEYNNNNTSASIDTNMTKTFPLSTGKIQLQSAGSEIYFKKIKIRSIDSFPPKYTSEIGW